MRNRFDQLRGRFHTLGLRETLSIQQDVLRRIFKSTLAATLAWLAVELIHSPRPSLASLAAILVVQLTVRSSLTRGIQLTVAVTLGLISALAAGNLFGLHWWTITLIVLAGLTVGEVMRLGALSSQVAISGMLALSLGSGYGIDRAVDTTIGAIIGALVSIVVAPPTYVAEAGRSLRALGEDLGLLLGEIGAGLTQGRTDEPTLSRWLGRARGLAAASRSAIATVKQGEESLQYNPRAKAELSRLEKLLEARRALDHVIGQTRGICRSLLEIDQPITEKHTIAVLRALGEMLDESGRAVGAFGRLVERPSSVPDRLEVQAGRVAALDRSADMLKALDDADVHATGGPAFNATVRLLSSVVVDLQRLLEEVNLAGPHAAAVTD